MPTEQHGTKCKRTVWIAYKTNIRSICQARYHSVRVHVKDVCDGLLQPTPAGLTAGRRVCVRLRVMRLVGARFQPRQYEESHESAYPGGSGIFDAPSE